MLDISTVGGGKVADWFNGVFRGIGPKNFFIEIYVQNNLCIHFLAYRINKGHLHDGVLVLLPESI